jgi:hypothetical protein
MVILDIILGSIINVSSILEPNSTLALILGPIYIRDPAVE